MEPAGRPPARTGAIILAALILLVPGVTVPLFLRSIRCPSCLGDRLLREPRETGEPRWVSARDLIPVPCGACSDHGRISLFNRWRWRPEEPVAQLHRAGDLKVFAAQQRVRMAALQSESADGTRGSPPIGTSRRPDLVPVLAAAMEDEDGEIRRLAAQALAAMNHGDTVQALVRALGHEDRWLNSIGAQGLEWLALSEPHRETIVRILTGVVDSGDPARVDQRFYAACVLFELGELRSGDIFVEALKGSHSTSEVIPKAIVQFNRKDAIYLMIRQFASSPPSHDRPKRYGRALEMLTGEKFGEDPVAWYRWLEKNRDKLPKQAE